MLTSLFPDVVSTHIWESVSAVMITVPREKGRETEMIIRTFLKKQNVNIIVTAGPTNIAG